MSITVTIIDTEDIGTFPSYPAWINCDRCGSNGGLPYYPPDNVSDLYPTKEWSHAAHVLRSRARKIGWVAPGPGGFDVCPQCDEEIEAEIAEL